MPSSFLSWPSRLPRVYSSSVSFLKLLVLAPFHHPRCRRPRSSLSLSSLVHVSLSLSSSPAYARFLVLLVLVALPFPSSLSSLSSPFPLPLHPRPARPRVVLPFLFVLPFLVALSLFLSVLSFAHAFVEADRPVLSVQRAPARAAQQRREHAKRRHSRVGMSRNRRGKRQKMRCLPTQASTRMRSRKTSPSPRKSRSNPVEIRREMEWGRGGLGNLRMWPRNQCGRDVTNDGAAEGGVEGGRACGRAAAL